MPLVLMVVMQAVGVPPTTPPAVRSIERGQTSWVDSPRQVAARTPEEWAALWRSHAPDRPLPAVDFSKDMVVAIFLGSRPSAGYSVEITGVKKANGAVVVQYHEAKPRADAVTAQVITAPYHLVVIPRPAGDVIFEKMER
jgi:protease stability complex PrcB-like protein